MDLCIMKWQVYFGTTKTILASNTGKKESKKIRNTPKIITMLVAIITTAMKKCGV